MRGERFRPGALLFDMDGLLVDSEPLWFLVERDFCAARGGAWTHELWHACIGRGMPHTLRTMRDAFGIDIDEARDAAIIAEQFIARIAELELKPGALALLDRAKDKVPIALASSASSALVEAILARFSLRDRFAAVVTGERVARTKPAPDIFLLAARELHVEPRRCAVFEDSIAGVTAGRAANMFVVAVPEGDPELHPFDELADLVVSSLAEALPHLELP